jgi:UDP-3-O-acyl N-acetylglucosamine deacetylase
VSELNTAKTLKQAVALSGVGLHSGLTTNLRLCPAPAGSGIVFVRTDLPGKPSAKVQQIDHNAAPFRTVIKNGEAEFHTVEHLLSALAAFQISDCIVEMDGLETPGLDGSAKDFCDAIQHVGIETFPNSNVAPIVVSEAVTLEEGIAKISALPNPGGMKISYTLNYPGNALAQGSYDFALNQDAYLKEIAPARTFAIKKDAEMMRAAGLGKGANMQNTVIIDGERALETSLRFSNEPVRHKILDLIGDLYILGRPVHAHIVASCSGHKINRALAMRLADKFPPQ